MSQNERGRAQPTHEWEQIELLCTWPEQHRYEAIRPLVLFDVPMAGRVGEVGLSASTLYRRLGAFEAEGMESLFGSSHARPQPRLFALDALGGAGWLKALRLEGYSPRSPRRPQAPQQAPFPYADAL